VAFDNAFKLSALTVTWIVADLHRLPDTRTLIVQETDAAYGNDLFETCATPIDDPFRPKGVNSPVE
jgi:hypothetical protein